MARYPGDTMKATTLLPQAQVRSPARLDDYLQLVRPRIALLVLFTVGAGALLASRGTSDLAVVAHAVIGTALVASGASCLNQLIERDADARMRRTDDRPLPAGRVAPVEALCLGIALGIGGLVYLLASAPSPLAAGLAGLALVGYVGVYTPLKRRTTLNTLVGAVPGALPPVIGWTAVTGRFDAGSLALFLIVFVWQVPHFLAIAWMYRGDYARAGFRMLPVQDARGELTGREMTRYCLALIPVSILPAALGLAGPLYAAAALVLGVLFLKSCVGFAGGPSLPRARRVLRASLMYLPCLLLFLVLNGSR
jgi:protoheme IX farnesyltransferase